jgi:SAM-dependent methyltransferase
MTDLSDLRHLNELYAASEDPWHTRSGWYQQRKRQLLLACLTEPRYAETFEPGCGDGTLTQALATRSDRVLAVDNARELIGLTRQRTEHLSNVSVERAELPQEWPHHRTFDLIVLHEIGLTFDPAHWADLAASVRDSLAPDGTVLACHWKHAGGTQLAAETLHGLLHSILGMPRYSKVSDADFILDVWTNRSRTLAEREGIA